MRRKTWLVIPDLQIPYHDPLFVKNLISLMKRTNPTGVLCVGDEIDLPQPSRWSKGWAEEFAGTLERDMEMTHSIMGRLRRASGDVPFHLMRSNHGDRLQNYLRRYAPAFQNLSCLQYKQLLGYDKLGITYHELPFRFAPGWVMAHGDEGGLRKHAGWTAMGLAEKFGCSVVCGHTHRMGLVPVSRGFGGRTKTIWGMEVGHGMELSKAHYMPALSANWQAGCGIIFVEGKRVQPVLLPYDKGFLL